MFAMAENLLSPAGAAWFKLTTPTPWAQTHGRRLVAHRSNLAPDIGRSRRGSSSAGPFPPPRVRARPQHRPLDSLAARLSPARASRMCHRGVRARFIDEDEIGRIKCGLMRADFSGKPPARGRHRGEAVVVRIVRRSIPRVSPNRRYSPVKVE